MADERGGARVPSNPASYSGVGKNSRRTDGRVQPQRAPRIQEGTDLTIGEGRIIEQGQRIAPLSRIPAPRVQAPTPGAPAGAGGGSAQLPPHLFGGDSTRPDEPITEGLPFGPGGGPEALLAPDPTDDMEVVLQGLIDLTGDQGIADMLSEHREFKAWRAERETPVGVPVPQPQQSALEAVPDLEGEVAPEMTDDIALPEVDEVGAVEGEEDTLSVETPEAAPATEGGEGEPPVLPPPA